MASESGGMLKIVVYFFVKVFYILIPIKLILIMSIESKISPISLVYSSIEDDFIYFEHRIYINYLTGHKLQ
tara:strand:- start:74 stop:286 length:213 start_codon:yes stop_codon:yes gene_type:complete